MKYWDNSIIIGKAKGDVLMNYQNIFSSQYHPCIVEVKIAGDDLNFVYLYGK